MCDDTTNGQGPMNRHSYRSPTPTASHDFEHNPEIQKQKRDTDTTNWTEQTQTTVPQEARGGDGRRAHSRWSNTPRARSAPPTGLTASRRAGTRHAKDTTFSRRAGNQRRRALISSSGSTPLYTMPHGPSNTPRLTPSIGFDLVCTRSK